MKKKTIYHIILDQSGSMSDVKENTISGFNEQITRIRQLTKDYPNQEIGLGVTFFNSTVSHYYFDESPAKALYINEQSYRTAGQTALLDAIGSAVHQLENLYHSQAAAKDLSVVVIIITDGYENYSRLFNLSTIRNTIHRLEESDRWTFSFLGATLDAVETAKAMAIQSKNSMSFKKDSMNREVWDKLGFSMQNYMNKKEHGGDLKDLYNNEK